MTPTDHAAAIAALPDETVALVLDALCVRAMDFVAGRIGDDYVSDLSADTARELLYADHEPTVEPGIFDPDAYRVVLNALRRGVLHVATADLDPGDPGEAEELARRAREAEGR